MYIFMVNLRYLPNNLSWTINFTIANDFKMSQSPRLTQVEVWSRFAKPELVAILSHIDGNHQFMFIGFLQ